MPDRGLDRQLPRAGNPAEIYRQQLGRENIRSIDLTQLYAPQAPAAEAAAEIDEFAALKQRMQEGYMARDVVILSPAAQKFLEYLRQVLPLDPYMSLHVNYIKRLKLNSAFGVLVDKITGAYRLVFASMLNKRFF